MTDDRLDCLKGVERDLLRLWSLDCLKGINMHTPGQSRLPTEISTTILSIFYLNNSYQYCWVIWKGKQWGNHTVWDTVTQLHSHTEDSNHSSDRLRRYRGAQTWWARHIKSRSCLCRNLATTSAPKVKDTPRSFSPQPMVSLSGSLHSRSHSRPLSGTSVGRMMRLICSIDCRSGLNPTSVQVFAHSLCLL